MRTAELTLYLAIALVASIPLIHRAQRAGRGAWWWVAGALGICLAGAIAWPEPSQEQVKFVDELPGRDIGVFLPEFIADEGFTTSNACHSCHPGNYASWHRTFHRTMTQVASPESVLAPFDNVVLENEGITYRLWREADEFWAELPDPNVEQILTMAGQDVTDAAVQSRIPRVKRRIVMTTGSHTFQGYWVPSTRGRELLQFPWVYVLAEQRWLPYESVFLRPPGNGRRVALWNNSCIQCHSLDGNPKGVGELGMLESETVELGISCEACHGPGAEHIRKHQNPLARYQQRWQHSDDTSIVNPAKMTPDKSSEVCGQCHSVFLPQDVNDWWVHGFDHKAGDPLEKSRRVFHFGTPDAEAELGDAARNSYWADGTMRVGGREYVAMSASPCFAHGQPESQMSCLSCHSMHHADPNDQLAERMDGNHACLQCHQSYAKNIEKHTHHAPSSSGSQCYNCHMPHTSYALLRALRSHRVVSPSVAGSVADGQPTGCNQCHLDKTLGWTSQYLKDWYDITPPPLTEDQQNISASVLWLLRGDASQRAIAAWTFGWAAAHEASGDQWEAAILAQLLDDPYDAVRFMVFDSLRKLPGYRDTDYDFIAPPPERTLARRRILAAWSRRAEDWSGRDLEAVLIDPSGLRQDVVDRLQAERDDRPVEFPE
jgi:predicted CXXCH cytochrome family protein